MADVAGFVVQDSIHADRVSRHGKSDDRWTKSRQLAADALAAFGRSPGPPQFPGTTWIPATE
jgi:hypothetical protein